MADPKEKSADEEDEPVPSRSFKNLGKRKHQEIDIEIDDDDDDDEVDDQDGYDSSNEDKSSDDAEKEEENYDLRPDEIEFIKSENMNSDEIVRYASMERDAYTLAAAVGPPEEDFDEENRVEPYCDADDRFFDEEDDELIVFVLEAGTV